MVTTPIALPAGFTGTGAHLVSEANGYRSRESLVVKSGSGKLPAGTLLGKLDADGKFKPYTPGATDGSQTVAAVSFEAIDATAADVNVTGHVRDCEMQRAMLKFVGAVDAAGKALAYTHLAARGIALR
jgi:hypothetical protein